ncbi:MAG: hypothetical protein F6K00_08150 [Leptolyngbya sp. SIOISBB]|nr:hypothetical protein [Leptolyngbya sp. SIOISBB]
MTLLPALIDQLNSNPFSKMLSQRPLFLSEQFYLTYRFDNGYLLRGTLKGEHCGFRPETILSLYDFSIGYCQPDGRVLLRFDNGFGQFDLTTAQALLTGTHTASGSLFTLNYRTAEVSIYNAINQHWLTTTWSPDNWQVQACVATQGATGIIGSQLNSARRSLTDDRIRALTLSSHSLPLAIHF